MLTRDLPAMPIGSSKKAKIKSAIMHRAYKNKPLSARQKLANQLIAKNVILSNSVLAQSNAYSEWARQLLRYGKSQRPSHTEKYLHEPEKSSQQNLRRPTIKE